LKGWILKPWPKSTELHAERILEISSTISTSHYDKNLINNQGHGFFITNEDTNEIIKKSFYTATIVIISTNQILDLVKVWRSVGPHSIWIKTNKYNLIFILLIWAIARIAKKAGPLTDFKIDGLNIPRIIQIKLNRPRSKPATRWHIQRSRTLDFFETLNTSKIQYVILRWWEKCENLPCDEDIDILISEYDIGKAGEIASIYFGVGSVDMYSSTGLPGSDWRSLPYFPAYLSKKILTNQILYKNSFYIPDPECAFLLTVYHILFHKANRVSIESIENHNKLLTNDKRYEELLNTLQSKANIQWDKNFESLCNLLKDSGYWPPVDLLRKYLLLHPKSWLVGITPKCAKCPEISGDVIVFIIRDAALEDALVDKAIEWIQGRGFIILENKELGNPDNIHIKDYIRAGNWHSGPFSRSGGDPVRAIIAYDYCPKWDNQKNINIDRKLELRKWLCRQNTSNYDCNYIHSSDDWIEAKEYIHKIWPKNYESIYQKILVCDKYHFPPPSSGKLFSGGYKNRSRVELLQIDGREQVRKLYRSDFSHSFNRELNFITAMQGRVEWVPKLYSAGNNWITMEYYKNVLDGFDSIQVWKKLLGFRNEILHIYVDLFMYGYANFDLNINNIILTPSNNLRVIDFEFVYPYSQIPGSILMAYDVIGPPSDFSDDLPGQGKDVILAMEYWRNFFRMTSSEMKKQLKIIYLDKLNKNNISQIY
jgi:hypothetical protein